MSQISDFHQSSTKARPLGRLYLVLLLLSLALYASTAQRGSAWQDSGIFQWRTVHFNLTGWLGLALSHPLLIVLGKALALLPFGPVPWRINLVSAIAGAVTVANIGIFVRRLAPERPAAAWIAAGSYGLAHTSWWLATICESQALFAALFTAQLHVILTLVRRPSVSMAALLGLLTGLALNAHNLALLALPVYGVALIVMCARRRVSAGAIGAFVAAWLAGASFFLVLIILRATQFGFAEAIDLYKKEVVDAKGL